MSSSRRACHLESRLLICMSVARLGPFFRQYPSRYRTRTLLWPLSTNRSIPVGVLQRSITASRRQLILGWPAVQFDNWSSAAREEGRRGWSGTRGKLGRTIATLAPDNMAVGSVVEGLQPAGLWKYFEALSKIPRPSKFEERCVWHCLCSYTDASLSALP
jgi:hypothetical protein